MPRRQRMLATTAVYHVNCRVARASQPGRKDVSFHEKRLALEGRPAGLEASHAEARKV